VGEEHPRSHPRIIFLRLHDLSDSRWTSGRAVWRKVGSVRLSRAIVRSNAVDADRSQTELRSSHRPSGSCRYRIGKLISSSNDAVCSEPRLFEKSSTSLKKVSVLYRQLLLKIRISSSLKRRFFFSSGNTSTLGNVHFFKRSRPLSCHCWFP